MNMSRKAHFTEIGYGKLGQEVQTEFEKAAETACLRDAPVKITLNITVFPPKEQNVGLVSYDLKTTLPTRKSIAYDAPYDKNVVIATRTNDFSLMQQELFFPEPEVNRKEAVSEHV